MVRRFIAILCAWIVCANLALAESTATPLAASPSVDPSLASPTPGLTMTVESPSPNVDASGCFYAEVDYLLRWFKPVCLGVPIVTVGNPAAATPGAVGQPGTQVVVGGTPHKFEFGATSGVQATVGWRPGDGAFDLEVSGFLMDTASASQNFVASPNGSPASYLPYQATDNTQQALRFTVPGVTTGSSLARGSTHLWGVEANMNFPFTVEGGGGRFFGTFLVGGRYLDLTDRDRVTDTLQLVNDPSAVAVGADQFITRNQFAGPQIGTAMGLNWGNFSLEYTAKLAAGITHQVRIIEGSPLLTSSDPAAQLVPGPLLALPSNSGRETANRITLVPEAGVKSRLALTPYCSLSLGYTLLYWNKVLCPGDQMDGQVNVTQLPFSGPVTGPLAPKPLFGHTDYFTQGLDLGLEFRF